MTFLGNPCPCGWALDEIDENTKLCERCGRKMEKRHDGYWVQTTPISELRKIASTLDKTI